MASARRRTTFFLMSESKFLWDIKPAYMHFECDCPHVTPKLTNLINVPHTINQIQACGKPVPHNFKCGKQGRL
ncbi:hypothetical protein GBA52_006694 [Prunus armeniaca]|nr:hypothetical protein GBA52_006694 [Prunus armeniaca]